MPRCSYGGCGQGMTCSAYFKNPDDVVGYCERHAVWAFQTQGAYKIEEGLP